MTVIYDVEGDLGELGGPFSITIPVFHVEPSDDKVCYGEILYEAFSQYWPIFLSDYMNRYESPLLRSELGLANLEAVYFRSGRLTQIKVARILVSIGFDRYDDDDDEEDEEGDWR